MNARKLGAAAALAMAAGRLALGISRRRHALRLRGATAVVCGASRGLGRSIALELGRRGVAKIGICARHEHDLDAVAAELARMGVHVCAEACDLTRDEEVERFFANVAARLGPVDVLVTNAATLSVMPAAVATRADYDEALSSIFHTALAPVLAVLPSMRRRRRGTIAFVTSIGARIGVPHLAPYCAAKAAVLGFAESIRAELAGDGVHVLTVVPGLMRTGSHVHVRFKGDHDREYAWFGASATAPLISVDADRAARLVVTAIARGKTELAFTPEARLAPALRTLAPTLWSEMLGMVARFLPRPSDDPVGTLFREGLDIERTSESPAVRLVRDRGRPLAERHGQVVH